VQTNIIGSENIVFAANANAVPRTLLLSTDKSVNPVNLYGATKLCAEKIVSQANAYASQSGLAVRLGPLRPTSSGKPGERDPAVPGPGSSGAADDHRRANGRGSGSRSLQAVDFVVSSLAMMEGGEVFVPKIPTMRVLDIAESDSPTGRIGRTPVSAPGEKLHEVLVTEDESRHARRARGPLRDLPGVSQPGERSRTPADRHYPMASATPVTRTRWRLTPEELRAMLPVLSPVP